MKLNTKNDKLNNYLFLSTIIHILVLACALYFMVDYSTPQLIRKPTVVSLPPIEVHFAKKHPTYQIEEISLTPRTDTQFPATFRGIEEGSPKGTLIEEDVEDGLSIPSPLDTSLAFGDRKIEEIKPLDFDKLCQSDSCKNRKLSKYVGTKCRSIYIVKRIKARLSRMKLTQFAEDFRQKHPNYSLTGRVTLLWTISPQGKAKSFRTKSNNIKHPKVLSWASNIVSKLQFYGPGTAGCEIEWYLDFGGTS